jgi:hypothetical protein
MQLFLIAITIWGQNIYLISIALGLAFNFHFTLFLGHMMILFSELLSE